MNNKTEKADLLKRILVLEYTLLKVHEELDFDEIHKLVCFSGKPGRMALPEQETLAEFEQDFEIFRHKWMTEIQADIESAYMAMNL